MAAYDTNPIPSPTEVFVDRDRKITSKWYPWMVRLFKLLRTTANGLEAVQETVDQVNGTWTLSINNNNRVTGYVKLDGSAVSTTFAVLADKFTIVHPSIDGTTIQAFIVGLVNGVPTVGINGNLIVDQTIVASKIVANTLSAINANLGTVTAGRMMSTDGKMLIDLDNKIFKISS